MTNSSGIGLVVMKKYLLLLLIVSSFSYAQNSEYEANESEPMAVVDLEPVGNLELALAAATTAYSYACFKQLSNMQGHHRP